MPLPTSLYVTYVRLFVVVPKCKMFTCGYMQCVCNKCVHIEAQKYTTMFVSSQPCSIHLRQFIHLLLFIRCNVQQCNGYLGIKHYPCVSLTFYNCFYWALYATNNTLPECLLFHYCLHTLNMTLFVRAEEFISLQSFMFVSTAVVELLDSTTICMSINNTLAEIVCCFS